MRELKTSELLQLSGPQPAAQGIEVHRATLWPELQVTLVRGRLSQETRSTVCEDTESLHFGCWLEGSFSGRIGNRKHFECSPGISSVGFLPCERIHSACSPEFSSLEITTSYEGLLHLAGQQAEELLGAAVADGHCLSLSLPRPRVSAAAARVVSLVGDDKRSLLQLHAATLELLDAQLATLAPARTGRHFSTLDHTRLRQAHDLLLSDLSHAPTITHLAQQVGLSAIKLKQGFRLVYGAGVYEVFQQARMNKAQSLLQRRGANVTEVAFALGYSNPSHFSAAFRRQTGQLPRQVLRERGQAPK